MFSRSHLWSLLWALSFVSIVMCSRPFICVPCNVLSLSRLYALKPREPLSFELSLFGPGALRNCLISSQFILGSIPNTREQARTAVHTCTHTRAYTCTYACGTPAHRPKPTWIKPARSTSIYCVRKVGQAAKWRRRIRWKTTRVPGIDSNLLISQSVDFEMIGILSRGSRILLQNNMSFSWSLVLIWSDIR